MQVGFGADGRREFGRRLLWLVGIGAVLAPACAMRSWHATPLAEEAVYKKAKPKRTIRVGMPTGTVVLDVVNVRYPLVEGRAHPGGGEALFDVTKASRAEGVAGAVSSRLATSPEQMRRAELVGKLVRFHTEAGPLMLEVTSFEYPLARGRPGACPAQGNEKAPCPGRVHLDLREASRLEVLETDGGKSVLVTLGVVTVVWGVGVLLWLGSAP